LFVLKKEMPPQKIVNQDFFKHWSSEMAYVLGFFTADGNLNFNERGAYYLEFNTADRGLLADIKNILGSDHKLSDRKRGANFRRNYRLQIGSKTMFEDLLDLGITPRKSKTIRLPDIPHKYFRHFTRGYFDGDGNVTIGHYIRANRNNKKSTTLLSGFISGSEIFLKELHQKLKEVGSVKGGTLYYHDGGYRLYFSVNDSYALYRFMYQRGVSSLYLDRKRKTFEKYFKITQSTCR